MKLHGIFNPISRYYPVANLTRTRQAVLVEPLRPERFFVRTFNATSLYILSICEVCGSYQCPYCPFYSAADGPPGPNYAVMVVLSVVALVYAQVQKKGFGFSECRT